MNKRNCPNCGAPYELDKVKCPYCGTLVFDITGLDLSENTPVFIRYRVPYDKKRHCMSYWGEDCAYIIQCAIPHLESIEQNADTVDLTDMCGNVVKKAYRNRYMTTNLKFDAIPFGEGKELMKIEIEEE